MEGMQRKRNPAGIKALDFFTGVETLRGSFARLVGAQAIQTAVIPSASYGLQTAISNLPVNKGDHALVIGGEFPSDYYNIESWCAEHHKTLTTIAAPPDWEGRGRVWNERILEAIRPDTIALVISSVHWMLGTRFDLEAIGRRCRETGTYFIVDGSQSVGAIPMDVQAFNIDALVCVGYKWLLGPYSIGMAAFSEKFNEGRPIEETWTARVNAEDFTSLTDYNHEYKPGATRFSTGESSNFILAPMLNAAIEQLLEWQPAEIAQYCRQLSSPFAAFIREKGGQIEEEAWRSPHLFGFGLPPGINGNNFIEKLQGSRISVSRRGQSIRVSPHLYNTAADFLALEELLMDSF